MAEVQAAGFGGSINLDEILIIMQLLFLALVLVNLVFTSPEEGFFQGMQNRVLGYPECTSSFCLLPSQASISTLSTTFISIFGGNIQPLNLVNIIFSAFDVLKGLIGTLVALSGLVFIIRVIYEYYYYTGVFQEF